MFFITRWNLKILISILIFTFYIINQISIIILHRIRLVFLIFRIKLCLTEVLEQPWGGTPTLNTMAIHDQCHANHANVSKQITIMADVDVAPLHDMVYITWLAIVFHWEMSCNKNASFIAGDCNKNVNISTYGLYISWNILSLVDTLMARSWEPVFLS